MRVLNEQGTVPADQWEAIGFYVVFAFRKTRNVLPAPGATESESAS